MAGYDAGVSSDNALAAILLLAAINETMQAYGTLNSSPWTAESFGADDRRAKALKEYVSHAVVFSMATGTLAAVVAHGSKATAAIMLGTAGTNAYLVWLYTRASKRGRAAGSSDWANASSGHAGVRPGGRWRAS